MAPQISHLTALFLILISQIKITFPFIIVNEVQVACYKILNSLFTLGTKAELSDNRKFIKTEMNRHRPALGNCLGAFAGTFPVAFLEPMLNKHNEYSIHGRLQETSLEAQGRNNYLGSFTYYIIYRNH